MIVYVLTPPSATTARLKAECLAIAEQGHTPLNISFYIDSLSFKSKVDLTQAQRELTMILMHSADVVYLEDLSTDAELLDPIEAAVLDQGHLPLVSDPSTLPLPAPAADPEALNRLEMRSEITGVLGNVTRTLLRKNQDYGSGNIAMTGELGVVVRLTDKVSRLLNLFGFKFSVTQSGFNANANSSPNFEALEDTWLDLIGYGVIGTLVRSGKWC